MVYCDQSIVPSVLLWTMKRKPELQNIPFSHITPLWSCETHVCIQINLISIKKLAVKHKGCNQGGYNLTSAYLWNPLNLPLLVINICWWLEYPTQTQNPKSLSNAIARENDMTKGKNHWSVINYSLLSNSYRHLGQYFASPFFPFFLSLDGWQSGLGQESSRAHQQQYLGYEPSSSNSSSSSHFGFGQSNVSSAIYGCFQSFLLLMNASL